MRILILLSFLMGGVCMETSTFAQDARGKLHYEQSPLSTRIYYTHPNSEFNESLTMRDVENILKTDKQAYEEFMLAKSNYITSAIIAGIGAGMVGWQIGAAFGNQHPNWTVVGVGTGIVLSSLLFEKAFSKHAKKAVEYYNKGSGDEIISRNLVIGVSPLGAGLVWSF
ncbi:hypothetical protein V6R21_26850 [Limibacter armeniacum]|uniref:hypothetical protein n=1 Tax=Limibacter armeniacum TaxID=466084 RepID=UPI002FE603EB